MNFKSIPFTICFFFFGAVLTKAQEISIFGKVVESENNSPIQFATVVVVDASTKAPITGTTTNENGEFEFSTKIQKFYVEISFIGFKTNKITTIVVENNQVALGTRKLEEDTSALDEVIVRAQTSHTVFKLDKRIFNVGKDLSSTGASALEVLNNVPSVNVDIEGTISLRGSTGVQILINGKPSVITDSGALGTITADMIESIEVITNPSAKYDAEGTSGIINIIMKKSEKKSLNGSISLNTGVPNNHSVGLSLNKRSEKLNLFSQIGYGRRTYINENESITHDIENSSILSVLGENDKNEKFFNLILGTDYHINDLNVLTLSGNYAFEDELEHSDKNYTLQEGAVISDIWSRNELTTAGNPKWRYELQYKKDFKDDKDRSLLFSALGRSFSKDKNSTFTNTTCLGNNPDALQRAHTDFGQADYTFKLDYTHPFSDIYTIETGMQYVINDVSNDYSVDDYIDGSWVENATYTNVFNYNQDVLGLYITTAYKAKKWGLKIGLRLENTNLKTELANTNELNNQNYVDVFPSAHTSYKVTDNISLQLGYSKRIYRPRLWSLNPFTSFRDDYNISTGNPNLQPEYSDSFEITSIYKFNKLSLNVGVYHRTTQDVIERVISYSDNVSTTMPQNIGIKNTTGLELNAKYSPMNWFTLTSDLNFNSFKREGNFNETSFDFKGESWSAKVTTKFILPASFTLEMTGNYRSKYQTVQQTISKQIYMNLGIRKKIMNGKLTTSLSVRDVFNSRKRETITDQTNFYKTAISQRGRSITFGLSFGFGKGEAMEFTGGGRRY